MLVSLAYAVASALSLDSTIRPSCDKNLHSRGDTMGKKSHCKQSTNFIDNKPLCCCIVGFIPMVASRDKYPAIVHFNESSTAILQQDSTRLLCSHFNGKEWNSDSLLQFETRAKVLPAQMLSCSNMAELDSLKWTIEAEQYVL